MASKIEARPRWYKPSGSAAGKSLKPQRRRAGKWLGHQHCLP